MKFIKTFVLFVFFITLTNCGVKGDLQPVNEEQKQTAMPRYEIYKQKYHKKGITDF